ncbi:hypothetical protein [Streptomyces sp. NBC_00038]|uniref:hypothetical protein n=1 Tax=Streptomyces sp. NBC_00038 TaxID=2903615 RepID=UPI00224F876B|nr:hypothetical protein [Streptomyces sp. NBC_00038]MCX5560107.1 hypothetical protein [Streptomyces sp. NBC_00038]
MKRFTLPRTGIAAAASVLSLALATGCSDSGSDSGDGDKATGGKESTAAAKVLSSSELEKAIIATGDADGFEVSSATDSEPFASSKEKVKVVDEKCAPIAYVLTGFAPGDSEAAYLNRQVTPATEEIKPSATSSDSLEDSLDSITDALNSTMTIVSLSSYEGDGAQETLASVSEAVEGCASGFTVAAGSDTQKFTKVASEKASGSGDESVAFAVTGDAEGDEVVVKGEVVRHGSTVATYYSINLAAFSGEAGAGTADYDVPAEVIDAQAAKLG